MEERERTQVSQTGVDITAGQHASLQAGAHLEAWTPTLYFGVFLIYKRMPSTSICSTVHFQKPGEKKLEAFLIKIATNKILTRTNWYKMQTTISLIKQVAFHEKGSQIEKENV
jgi:hypothetical protein